MIVVLKVADPVTREGTSHISTITSKWSIPPVSKAALSTRDPGRTANLGLSLTICLLSEPSPSDAHLSLPILSS